MAGATTVARRRGRLRRVPRARPGDLPPAAEPRFPGPRDGGRADQALGVGQRCHRPAPAADRGPRPALPARLAPGRPAGGKLGGLLRADRGAGRMDDRGRADLLAHGAPGPRAVDQCAGGARVGRDGIGPAAALRVAPRVGAGHARPPPAGLRPLSAQPLQDRRGPAPDSGRRSGPARRRARLHRHAARRSPRRLWALADDHRRWTPPAKAWCFTRTLAPDRALQRGGRSFTGFPSRHGAGRRSARVHVQRRRSTTALRPGRALSAARVPHAGRGVANASIPSRGWPRASTSSRPRPAAP